MQPRSALLLHGAGGGGWEWTPWRGVFQAHGLQVAAPDLQPAAGGIAATRLHDYARQAAEASARMAPPCVVIGASLGGLLAAQLAPQAAALLLVNPIPPSPWHAALARPSSDDVVAWHRTARLASTRDALPGADPASALHAFRHWRDESGAVLRDACAGVAIPRPACPVLCIASLQDTSVPAAVTTQVAQAWNAELLPLPGSAHVDPLLGRDAAALATRVLAWLSAR